MNNIDNIRFAHDTDYSKPLSFPDNPLFQVAGDGKLPRSFFTVLAKVKGVLTVYVTKGDIIIGRIEFEEAPAWLLKGSVMSLVGPMGGTVYHGNMLTGGESVGLVTDFAQTFNDMVDYARKNIPVFSREKQGV